MNQVLERIYNNEEELNKEALVFGLRNIRASIVNLLLNFNKPIIIFLNGQKKSGKSITLKGALNDLLPIQFDIIKIVEDNDLKDMIFDVKLQINNKLKKDYQETKRMKCMQTCEMDFIAKWIKYNNNRVLFWFDKVNLNNQFIKYLTNLEEPNLVLVFESIKLIQGSGILPKSLLSYAKYFNFPGCASNVNEILFLFTYYLKPVLETYPLIKSELESDYTRELLEDLLINPSLNNVSVLTHQVLIPAIRRFNYNLGRFKLEKPLNTMYDFNKFDDLSICFIVSAFYNKLINKEDYFTYESLIDIFNKVISQPINGDPQKEMKLFNKSLFYSRQYNSFNILTQSNLYFQKYIEEGVEGEGESYYSLHKSFELSSILIDLKNGYQKDNALNDWIKFLNRQL